MKAIVHRQAVVNRLINNTHPYIITTAFGGASTPIVGSPYNVVNTSGLTPIVGQLNIPPSGLTLRINAVDDDNTNHSSNIASLPVGTIITIGSESCTLTGTPISNTGVFSLFVDVLPVVVDGKYLVTANIPPTNVDAPFISGNSGVGHTLTCTSGTYSANPAPVLSYQWYVNSVLVSGQTAKTYVIQEVDVGLIVNCREKATNSAGNVEVTSNGITATASLIPIFTNASHEYVEGTVSTGGVGVQFPADNDDGSFAYVFDDTNTTSSSDGYVVLDGSTIKATTAAVNGPPNDFGTLPNQFIYVIKATSSDGTGTGTITLNCIDSVSGEDPIITTAKAILATYGANAHVWVAGIDARSGYPANNYVDNGITPAVVGNTIEQVTDATGTYNMEQANAGNKPILREDGDKFYWEFDGGVEVSTMRNFTTTGKIVPNVKNFALLIGLRIISNLPASQQVFIGQTSSTNSTPLTELDAAGSTYNVRMIARGDDNVPASASVQALILGQDCVVSGRGTPTDVEAYKDVAKLSVANTANNPSSTDRSFIGCRKGVGGSLDGSPMYGRVYCAIAIDGLVSDADLRSLQDYVALLSGVTF